MTDILGLLALAALDVWRLEVVCKGQLRWMPGVAGAWFLDCIFVRRNWQEDKAEIDKLFDEVNQHNIPMWLVSFLKDLLRAKKTRRLSAFGLEHFISLNTPLYPR